LNKFKNEFIGQDMFMHSSRPRDKRITQEC